MAHDGQHVTSRSSYELQGMTTGFKCGKKAVAIYTTVIKNAIIHISVKYHLCATVLAYDYCVLNT